MNCLFFIIVTLCYFVFFCYSFHRDLKRTLVAMTESTGMSVSQVTDEVLYTGLIEMQEL